MTSPTGRMTPKNSSANTEKIPLATALTGASRIFSARATPPGPQHGLFDSEPSKSCNPLFLKYKIYS